MRRTGAPRFTRDHRKAGGRKLQSVRDRVGVQASVIRVYRRIGAYSRLGRVVENAGVDDDVALPYIRCIIDPRRKRPRAGGK